MSPILTTVSELRARTLAASRAARKPVVGVIGSVVPAEVVLAAGCHPVHLAAQAADFWRDCAPMETFHEPEIRSLFRQAVTGQFAHCSLLVIASSSDGYRYLYQYLAEMQRTGRGEGIPPLHHFDFQFGDAVSVDAYNHRVMRGLITTLESLSGAPCDSVALRAAIDEVDTLRRGIAELQVQRANGLITGCAALRITAGIDWSSPERSAAALQEQGRSQRLETATRGFRLLLASSEVCYHEHLHDLVERCGAQVVVENDEWGSRRAGPPIAKDGDPLEVLSAHYKAYVCSPRQPTRRREEWLRSRLASDFVDALLLYAPPSDQYFGWECPALGEMARSCGKPALLLRHEALNAGEADEIGTELQAWLATFAPRSAATAPNTLTSRT